MAGRPVATGCEDTIRTVLAGREIGECGTREGKAKLTKEELWGRCKSARRDPGAEEIYFTEFLIQRLRSNLGRVFDS